MPHISETLHILYAAFQPHSPAFCPDNSIIRLEVILAEAPFSIYAFLS